MDRDELEDARDELLEDNEDDLEYHITFPSPTLNESTSSSGGKKAVKDFVFVNNGDFGADTEPVVFLLGWAGCREGPELETFHLDDVKVSLFSVEKI